MPELPEVEIVRRNLERWALGRRIERVEVLRAGCFRDETLSASAEVVGSTITGFVRRGKALWMATSGPVGWLMRFGMTGKWVQQSEELPRFTRTRLWLDAGPPLCFVDMRNFGGLWAWPQAEGPQRLREEVSGIDPLLEGLSGLELGAVMAGTGQPIKVALLDQARVAGVGNIYAVEALFRAGIHPRAPARGLSVSAYERLAQALVEVLRWAVEAEAADEVLYLSEPGSVNRFQVYQREGAPCPRCAAPIQREVLAQRSTFFCDGCQREGVGSAARGG